MVVGVLALLLSIPEQAQAAYNFYVAIKGQKQGDFKGDLSQKGPPEKVPSKIPTQHKIPGVRFQYMVTSPRDLASGQATGRRQHSPVVITKEWGPSSPQIFQACVTNEVVNVVIEFVRTNPNGQLYTYQTIMLTNAAISSIRQYANVANPGESPNPLGLEDISFTFQKIEIMNVDGQTKAMDDWMPRQ
jgi:type VI secretion system secreted protein Hcp